MTGKGEQTVVLLSGYGTASPVLDYTPLIDELDDTYTVVVIEQFGYGYSDLDVTQRTVEDISTELHETLSTLGVKDLRPDGPLPGGNLQPGLCEPLPR